MELESRENITHIEQLPGELLYQVTRYLSSEELDACFNTCVRWRYLLNVDSLWKQYCLYPEKYFISSEKYTNNDISKMALASEICKWRQRFEYQKNLIHNWRIGKYTVSNTRISPHRISLLRYFVDDDGNHWLLEDGRDEIKIWNISTNPNLLTSLKVGNNFGSSNFVDKILVFWPSCISVFQFPPAHRDAKPLYRFKFEMNATLNDDTVISDDDYESGVRYIIVGSYFVGYRENVTDIHQAKLHLWNVDKGEKIGEIAAYEQSFIDFIYEETGSDVMKDFEGGLLLFSSDSDRFLVNLIDDKHKLCQVSLFSIQEMMFLNVVARLKSRTAWCFMKGDIVSVYHENCQGTSDISIYKANGYVLTTLEFPRSCNPAFSNEFCFSKTKLFLKVADKLHIVSIINSSRVKQHTVNIKKEKYILQCFEPTTLLLFDKFKPLSSMSMTIVDVCTGQELWTLGNLFSLSTYSIIKNSSYPYKLVVQFEGNNELSILNFGQTNWNQNQER